MIVSVLFLLLLQIKKNKINYFVSVCKALGAVSYWRPFETEDISKFAFKVLEKKARK